MSEVYEADTRRHEHRRGRFHWPKPGNGGRSACGVALGDFDAWAPEGVAASDQCNRSGCKQAWDRWASGDRPTEGADRG